MNTENKILIVGAGIAGLSLARQFKRFNIPFTLIDKRAKLATTGAGIALPANAVRALRYMDLGEKIDGAAHRVSQIIYSKANGKVLGQASLAKPPLNSDHFVALQRSQLHEILAEGLAENIHLNSTVESLEENADGVFVKFDSPSLGAEQYAAVIGADGLYSQIRKIAFNDEPLVDLSITNWRWMVDYPAAQCQPTYFMDTTEAFMVYPISKTSVYCYAHIYDPNQTLFALNNHQQNLQKIFGHFGGLVPEMLQKLPANEQIIPGRLCSVPKALFSKGCVALVGDASNGCSPMLQQGAASAFEDVIVLSEFLAKLPVAEALSEYAAFRHDRVNWTINASDWPIKAIMKMQARPARLLRNLLIRLKGPLNVQGWKKLLSEDPLAELKKSVALK